MATVPLARLSPWPRWVLVMLSAMRSAAAGAGGRSFLADRDVRRAAIIVIADGIVSAGTQLDDHLLEFADDQHVFEDRDRLGGGDRLGCELRSQIALIAIRGDLAAIDHKRIEPRPHVAQIRARFGRHLVVLSSLQARAFRTRDPPGPYDCR